MVVDSDDEVAETLKDNPEDSPTPSCRADPHWQDAQGSPVLSPASSVPSLPSSLEECYDSRQDPTAKAS